MSRILDLRAHELKNLGQDRAVDFFRRLLWAESARVGIGRNLIDVPACINVGDGGVDAVIEKVFPSSDEVIPSGISGFQIKAGNLQPNKCKKELHEDRNLDRPIKPGILNLIKQGGTYVLVLFADITKESSLFENRKTAKEELERCCKTSNLKVRLYTITHLMGFTERFPSLIAWLRGGLYFLPYTEWAKQRYMQKPSRIFNDKVRDEIIKEIRGEINNSFIKKQRAVLRIMGLPGLGKTRLVLEALKEEHMKNSIIYFANSTSLHNNLNFIHYLTTTKDITAIVVVDECSLEHHEFFEKLLSSAGFRLSLITISYELSKPTLPTKPYTLKQLPINRLTNILNNEMPNLPVNVIERIASFADGYPRIAMLVAENYQHNKGASWKDILKIDQSKFMERLVGGENYKNRDYLDRNMEVLMGLAIFDKIGYKDELEEEAKWISKIVDIPWKTFKKIVTSQKKRGLIQGEYYIYVTPFSLVIYLLEKWFEDNWDKSVEEFMNSIPVDFRENLQKKFLSRIPYLATTDKGKNFIQKMFSQSGFFSKEINFQDPFVASFFLKLAEVEPGPALVILRETIGKWNQKQLADFKTGRREIVIALEYISQWKEYFFDAAKILLSLAEAENEIYIDNSTNVFTNLFLIRPAPEHSVTEVAPEERLEILKETITSKSLERQKITLKAFKKAGTCQ